MKNTLKSLLGGGKKDKKDKDKSTNSNSVASEPTPAGSNSSPPAPNPVPTLTVPDAGAPSGPAPVSPSKRNSGSHTSTSSAGNAPNSTGNSNSNNKIISTRVSPAFREPASQFGLFPKDVWSYLLSKYADFHLLRRFRQMNKALRELSEKPLLSRRRCLPGLKSPAAPSAKLPKIGALPIALCLGSKGRLFLLEGNPQNPTGCQVRIVNYAGKYLLTWQFPTIFGYGIAHLSSEEQVLLTCRDPPPANRGFVSRISLTQRDETTHKPKILQQFGRKSLVQPHDIVIDSHENILVADLRHMRVFVFTKAGVALREIVTDNGEVPEGRERVTVLAVDPLNDNVLELRPFQPIYTKARVKMFTPNGELVRMFPVDEADDVGGDPNVPANPAEITVHEKGTKAANPRSIDIDASGRIMMADSWSNRIIFYGLDGKRQCTLSLPQIGEMITRVKVLEDGRLLAVGQTDMYVYELA